MNFAYFVMKKRGVGEGDEGEDDGVNYLEEVLWVVETKLQTSCPPKKGFGFCFLVVMPENEFRLPATANTPAKPSCTRKLRPTVTPMSNLSLP